jgi:geranylgeranylglycerol-phosphate geranylgeranyltransferase
MTFNDCFDWPVDIISHPKRPIPKGVISPKEMLVFSIIFFTIGLVIAFYINLLCGTIITISILLLVFYEIFTKNIGITGNLTVAFISAMSFIFGGASVNNPFASIVISIITFFIIIGREIIMDIRDKEGDKYLRKTLPVQIGREKASYVACGFLLLSAIIAPLPYYLGSLSIYYLILIIPVIIISLISIIWLLRDIENAGFSAHLIRAALALGLIAFIAGIVI